MQAQDCSLLPTEATYLPRLTCPCGTQAWDSHQPTDAICQHSSAINTSICQPSPPDSLWSICLPSPHLPLTAHLPVSPLYATCGLFVCKAPFFTGSICQQARTIRKPIQEHQDLIYSVLHHPFYRRFDTAYLMIL
jgi:hypothetical protein